MSYSIEDTMRNIPMFNDIINIVSSLDFVQSFTIESPSFGASMEFEITQSGEVSIVDDGAEEDVAQRAYRTLDYIKRTDSPIVLKLYVSPNANINHSREMSIISSARMYHRSYENIVKKVTVTQIDPTEHTCRFHYCLKSDDFGLSVSV